MEVGLRHRSDSVADPTGAVKADPGGTSAHVPPPGEMLLDALSTRACVRLRLWVVNSIGHEEFRAMVRGIRRPAGRMSTAATPSLILSRASS